MAYSLVALVRRGFVEYERRYLEKTVSILESMFIFTRPELLLYFRIVGLFVLAVLGWIVFRAWPFVVGLAVLGYFLPQIFLKINQKRRLKKLEVQLVDGLAMLSNSLRAGLSLEKAIEFLVNESKPPISQEFGLVLKEYKLGIKLEEALANLKERVPSEDLALFVTSVTVVRASGGNLSEIFDKIAYTIRERHRIEGKIAALTSQGKLQGITVGAMPFILGLVLYLMDPNMILPFFRTYIGWAAILVILVLEALGVYFIMRIVKIEV